MIGYNLITIQTPKAGLPVEKVLVHEGVDIADESYLAFLHDRKIGSPVCVASPQGGMDIEEVAKNTPDEVKVFPVNIDKGMTEEVAAKIANFLGFNNGPMHTQAKEQLARLYEMFIKLDATQVEINPWATTPDKDLYCIDAKINIDDNALFRHKEIVEMKEKTGGSEDTDPNEQKARAVGLEYVALDGNIGCMVNGAGLAMGTMDIIKLKGGNPANFLDVGGGANTDQVKTGFEILNSHPDVKAIWVNIFGGIMKCDTIATGIIEAAKNIEMKHPVIVRLTGTNSDKAFKLLEDYKNSGSCAMDLHVVGDFNNAANEAVKLAGL